MPELRQAVVGIDLGTQGVRVIAVTVDGDVLAKTTLPLPPQTEGLPEGWH
jgi:sugar (pentulose or hexulose) kinase